MAKQRKTEGATATRRQPRRAVKDESPTPLSSIEPAAPTSASASASASAAKVRKFKAGFKRAPRKKRGHPKKGPTDGKALEMTGIIREEPEDKEGVKEQEQKKPLGPANKESRKSKAGVQKASKRGRGRPKKMLTTAQAIKRLGVIFEGTIDEKISKSKKRKEKKFMEDDPILREENDEGLQRSLRWLPVRGLRRIPSQNPQGVHPLVWESYSSMNAYMCAMSLGQIQRTLAEEEDGDGEEEEEEEADRSQQQPLKRPAGVPEPLWHAYHSLDDWMFRKCLTTEEVTMLPLEKTVDKAWPGAPSGFKYIAEDVLVFEDPEKVKGTAFEYKLTDRHLKQLKSGRRVSMGRRPSQSPGIDLGTFLPHDDLAMNDIDSDLAGWV